LFLADGRKLRVRHQDYLLISPTGEAVFAFSEPDGKDYEILEHGLIVSIERRV